MSRIRRIMHPTDFSRASAAAFRRGVQMAKREGASLLIAHVLSPVIPLAGDGYVSPRVYDDIHASTLAYAQKRLRALVAKARRGGVRARPLLLEGVAHEQIARAARSRKADLVVIGTHGRSGFARFILGSVASRVLAVAPCPVLTVRGK